MLQIFLRVFTDNHFLSAFLQTVILIFLGFILRRKGILGYESKRTIRILVWDISVPCVAFNAFMQDFNAENFLNGISVFWVSALMYAILFFTGKILFIKKGKDLSTVNGLFMAVGQVTLFSMPILLSVYNGRDAEVALNISMISVVFRIMVYIIGYYLISGEKIQAKTFFPSLKKIFLTPIMIGMFSGIIIWLVQNWTPQVCVDGKNYSFLRIDKTLPFLYHTVRTLTNLLNPLSMILIGMSIGEADFASAFKDIKAWISALGRNFIAPILTLFVALILEKTGLVHWNEYSLISLVIGFSAPVSVSLSVFCVQFNKEEMFASRTCMISTLLTLVSLPLSFVASYFVLSLL